MKSLEIKGVLREKTGKKASKDLRNIDSVPCVLYGGKENINFTATERDFHKLVYTPLVHTVKLQLGDTSYDAVMKDIQFHPVSDKIMHVDFFRIFEDKKVTMPIPVKLHGFAVGVKDGGKLNLELRRIKVKALPKDLPDTIDIDVETLELGKTIKISDLQLANMELLDPQNAVVASVRLTRVAKGLEETELAAAPTEEGAVATPEAAATTGKK